MTGMGITFDEADIRNYAQKAHLTFERGRGALAAEAHRECEEIMSDSKMNYVPVQYGVLRDSGTVDPPEVVGDRIVIEMYYGGPAEAYALAVHEHLSESSPHSWQVAEAQGRPVQFHPSGRGPKYLERPVLEHARGMEGRLGGHVASRMERL